ncbi:hypothetical protein AGMMS4957_21570 [Bacteroidia bacterium]|nr:hypothetical protein AGMMS4957_21570 [Bacteroidia bacterium]
MLCFVRSNEQKVRFSIQHNANYARTTKRPDLQASKELLAMVKLLAHTDEDTFMDTFEQWENRMKFIDMYFKASFPRKKLSQKGSLFF